MAVLRQLLSLVALSSLAWVLALNLGGFHIPLLSDVFFRSPMNPVWTAYLVILVSAFMVFKLYQSEHMQDGKVKSTLQNTSLGAVSGWFGNSSDVAAEAEQYWSLHKDSGQGTDVSARKENYMGMVNSYYNLVTDFYEYGWGKSFHFGRRFAGESHIASLARHEHWLAARAGFREGQTILDLGCGVGGPMRAIARFTGAKVVGVNNNDYQIQRGTIQNKEAGLSDLCSFSKNDFMNMRFANNFADGAYTIEAACHSPDKVAFFTEVKRVLKPGAVFVGYEWCLTDKFDFNNPDHLRIKKNIEEGDGLPDLWRTGECVRDLQEAGFEVIEAFDVSPVDERNPVPWYDVIEGRWSLQHFKLTRTGVALTHAMVWIMETIGLAPKGTTRTHEFLTRALPGLVDGGVSGVFTPMFYFKVRKPLVEEEDDEDQEEAEVGRPKAAKVASPSGYSSLEEDMLVDDEEEDEDEE